MKSENRLVRFSMLVMRWCLDSGTPCIFENVDASWVWELPFFRQIVKRQRAAVAIADLCQFGARWKKRTRFIGINISRADFAELSRPCPGPESCCPESGVRHQTLTGYASSGTPWTRVAKTYPKTLNKILGEVLLNSFHKPRLP